MVLPREKVDIAVGTTTGQTRAGAVLFVLMVGTFLAPLDASIVNIALPSIASELNQTVSAVGWVATAYLLTNAALLLSMGRLGDVWGLRRVYVSGMLLFGGGSALCAASSSLGMLVAARVVQAVGASMLFAAGPALVTRAFPAERRGAALGMISLSVSAGLLVGPSLGSLLVGTFGWPAIFIVNVPLSIVVAAIVAVVAGYRWWNSPERQINQLLADVATALSHENAETDLRALTAVASLQTHLTTDVSIDMGGNSSPIRGRQEVIATAARVRVSSPMMRVQFFDPAIAISGDSSGTTTVTVQVTTRDAGGQDVAAAYMVSMNLVLADGRWQIASARVLPEQGSTL
jgi:MFS family permease